MISPVSLGLALGLAVAASIPRFGWVAIWAFVIFMGAVSFGWNLLTAALLLVGLNKERGFLASLSRGVGASWTGRRLWWHLVLIQLLLLGLWVFVSYRYTHTSQALGGGRTENVGINFNFRFYAFWASGYEHECRWYTEFMKAVGADSLGVVATLLALVFGVLAIAVKLTIAERLWPGVEASETRGDHGT